MPTKKDNNKIQSLREGNWGSGFKFLFNVQPNLLVVEIGLRCLYSISDAQ